MTFFFLWNKKVFFFFCLYTQSVGSNVVSDPSDFSFIVWIKTIEAFFFLNILVMQGFFDPFVFTVEGQVTDIPFNLVDRLSASLPLVSHSSNI